MYIPPISILLDFFKVRCLNVPFFIAKNQKEKINMDIYEAIKKLSPKKATYFKWRFDLEYDKRKEKHSPERLAEVLGVKTLNEYTKWENTQEFLELTNIVLQSKFANDLEQAYSAISEKARTGDEKAIKQMMDLQKQIRAFNESIKVKRKEQNNEHENLFADLELD